MREMESIGLIRWSTSVNNIVAEPPRSDGSIIEVDHQQVHSSVQDIRRYENKGGRRPIVHYSESMLGSNQVIGRRHAPKCYDRRRTVCSMSVMCWEVACKPCTMRETTKEGIKVNARNWRE
jgi:hypothetical protein